MEKHTPHIVFLVLDTHRAKRMKCYGYPQETSPNIDTFAETATVYENAISPAQWTIPSHASMFSGECPSTHLVVQAEDSLNPPFVTIAELLHESGYTSTGFCNNPLVGVLNNGLRRGFDSFYNYGGAIPSPYISDTQGLFANLKHFSRKLLERIATPIQQSVANSADVFQFFMNPRLVNLWTRYANFKGDTRQSLEDAVHFLNQNVHSKGRPSPQMVFINLMETHLPYTPPEEFISKFAPIVQEDPEARKFIEFYNTRAFHWLLPIEEPYPDLESKTINDMYDAEIAYQDHLLHQLFETLDQPYHRENTMVILVGDHGEMLGEHLIMGHALGSYHELIHVPLIIRFPGQEKNKRIKPSVSTSHLFHTILDEVGIQNVDISYAPAIDTRANNLRYADQSPALVPVLSESFPPDNVILTMEKLTPERIRPFHSRAYQRSFIFDPYKLLQIEGVRNDLFNLETDRLEMHNLEQNPQLKAEMEQALNEYLNNAEARRPANMKKSKVAMSDERVSQRLRGLGYLD
jgi:arylsulfatase A-like enzyme